MMQRTLKIATWNVNGLVKYSQEIKTFIFSQNTDILFVKHILQTKATSVFLSTYCSTMHLDNKAHEEIAPIIRRSIRHEIDKYQREFLQTTSVVSENWTDCIIISADSVLSYTHYRSML